MISGSIWSERKPIAWPLSLLDKANALAHLIDPDTGGALTFSADRTIQIGGKPYVVAHLPFVDSFLPLVQARVQSHWIAAMDQLAEARGREPLTQAAVRELCKAMLMGDEVIADEVTE